MKLTPQKLEGWGYPNRMVKIGENPKSQFQPFLPRDAL